MTDDAVPGSEVDPDPELDLDALFEVFEERGRPLLTASEVARALDCTPAAAEDALTTLADAEGLEAHAESVRKRFE